LWLFVLDQVACIAELLGLDQVSVDSL
jgi:hypothetical protein